jgi:hypothetical protein
MNLLEHAKNELSRLVKNEDEMQIEINKDLLQVVEIFSKQGHSGGSAGYAISILERLLRFLPIGPLTGEDDEWNDISRNGGTTKYQNKRCSSVFKDENGRAWNIDGKIFSDNDGKSWYSSHESSVEVTFPYAVPLKSERVFVESGYFEE